MNYSRWATTEELKEKLVAVNYNSDIKVSGIPMMYDDNSLYIKSDEAHTMVIGSTGSGKTQSTLLPQLRLAIKANESFIVSDVKGELYNNLSGELKKQDYNTILIDLADPTKGNNFNPLSLPFKLYKDGKKDKAVELLETIGYYICTNEIRNPNIDPFWENSAISLFTGLALYLFENAKEKEINLNSLAGLTSNFDKITDYVKNADKSSLLYIYLSSIVLAPSETKGCIISVFNQNIMLFTTKEALSKLMSTTNFDIENVQKDKTALFIISDNKLYARKLIPLIIDECYQSSTIINDKCRKLNFFIDEFHNLIAINNFNRKLAFARGNNIRFNIYINSFLELNNAYGKENVEMLKFSFANIIYLLASDIETLEEISKMCGRQKNNGVLEPLVSVEELKLLDNFEAVILIPRINPIKTKLLPDYAINWNFDDRKVEIPELKNKEINIFDI